jgi:hypothetical protein
LILMKEGIRAFDFAPAADAFSTGQGYFFGCALGGKIPFNLKYTASVL